MINRRITLNPVGFSIAVLLLYYCFYEITTSYSKLNSANINIIITLLLFFCCVLLMFVIFKNGIIKINSWLFFAWCPFLCILFYQIMNYECAKSYFLIFFLFVMLLFCDINNSDKMLDFFPTVFRIMAIYYSIGVIIQIVFPRIQQFVLSILFNSNGIYISNSLTMKGYFPGFSHQVGDVAFCVSVGLLVELLFDSVKKRRIFLSILFVFVLLLQGKRSVVIFLPVCLIASYFLNPLRIKSANNFIKAISVVFSVLALLFLIVPFLNGTVLYSKFSAILPAVFKGSTNELIEITGRYDLYDFAISLFNSNNKLSGIGWGNFRNELSKHSTYVTSVHNVYLQILCETGLIGLVSLILGELLSFVFLFKYYFILKELSDDIKQKYTPYFLLCFAGELFFILFSFVENPLYNENCLIFYLLIVIASKFLYLSLLNVKNNSV